MLLSEYKQVEEIDRQISDLHDQLRTLYDKRTKLFEKRQPAEEPRPRKVAIKGSKGSGKLKATLAKVTTNAR